jgi:CRISPR/Cas system-associated endonuclease/helicase Cas3
MKLEDIVHTFNDYLTVNRTSKKLNHIGYMVLLRSSTSPSTFTKALKEYELKLIYVKEKE